MTREVTELELHEAAAGMTELNRNLDRYRHGLDKMADWPEIAEDEADNVVQLIFAAATALDELATEIEGLEA
jgi:cell division FtsZ-interacting protein ZapD